MLWLSGFELYSRWVPLKIDFVDFLQIQAAFWKTNYTFSYLPISMYEQDMSEI